MALFGFGKKGNGDQPNDKPAGDGQLEFSPQKAASWFNHARTSFETENFEYSAYCWLSGIRFNPSDLEALQQFFRSAQAAAAKTGTKVPKEVQNAIKGKTPVDRFLEAIMVWGFNPSDAPAALKAAETASEIGLREAGNWLAPKALELVARDPRARKDAFIRMFETFKRLENFPLAVQAGQFAYNLDRSDSKLSTELRDLAAKDTMSKGGYENTGQAGGFRANIKDAEKQRRLEEESRVSKGAETLERVIANAKAEHLANPEDIPNLKKYVAALLERDTEADQNTAISILEGAYAKTQQFTFRRTAGEVRLRQGRKRLRALEAAYKAAPNDEAAKEAFHAADKAQLAMEITEYEAQTAAYPTDLTVKFELGKRLYLAHRYDDAIAQLQMAQSDPKNRVAVMSFLGQSFMAIGWVDEAIDMFGKAIELAVDATDATALELRYGKMAALYKRAESSRDLASAEEADKLASQIATQQFNYLDIRKRREAIKELIKSIKG